VRCTLWDDLLCIGWHYNFDCSLCKELILVGLKSLRGVWLRNLEIILPELKLLDLTYCNLISDEELYSLVRRWAWHVTTASAFRSVIAMLLFILIVQKTWIDCLRLLSRKSWLWWQEAVTPNYLNKRTTSEVRWLPRSASGLLRRFSLFVFFAKVHCDMHLALDRVILSYSQCTDLSPLPCKCSHLLVAVCLLRFVQLWEVFCHWTWVNFYLHNRM